MHDSDFENHSLKAGVEPEGICFAKGLISSHGVANLISGKLSRIVHVFLAVCMFFGSVENKNCSD